MIVIINEHAAVQLVVPTSASAWEMLGMLPLMVITRSGLKQLTSLMELTVIRVSVSCTTCCKDM